MFKFSRALILLDRQVQCLVRGTESLPKGIVSATSNLEMRRLWGTSKDQMKRREHSKKSLLASAVGIRQKKNVDHIVKKFPPNNFTIMLFHYDGFVDQWRDLQWSDNVLHVSAVNQTKWWFANRFLHPDVVDEYNYIFLWDEDLGVEHFDPVNYLSIVEEEGLEISQPALDSSLSEVHHRITVRVKKSITGNLKIHRRTYKHRGNGRCYWNSTAPPCTGWVEMMAPVFSRVAWRCAWYMIQSDLIHAWGLDMKLGYCAQGDRSINVGVVGSEYVAHLGIPTLGGFDENRVRKWPALLNHSITALAFKKQLTIIALNWLQTIDFPTVNLLTTAMDGEEVVRGELLKGVKVKSLDQV
ncbi:uncharacterized protein LOC116257254 [Nymphaea colorata]|nr:uncharacterized protein LOC116257254 [Nymphaea colorata]